MEGSMTPTFEKITEKSVLLVVKIAQNQVFDPHVQNRGAAPDDSPDRQQTVWAHCEILNISTGGLYF